MELTLAYTLDADLQARGLREYGRKVKGLPIWGSLLILWVPLTLLVRWGLSKNWMRDAETWQQLGAAAFLAGLFVLFIGWKARRPRSRTAEAVSMRLDDQGLSKTSPQGEARIAWSAYLRFVETENYFFLHSTPEIVELIPKSALAGPEAVAACRALLESKVARTVQDGHPVLGKTRPVFYALFAGILVAMVAAVKIAGTSNRLDASVEQYLEWKDQDLVREVSIRSGGVLVVRLHRPYRKEGRSNEFVHVTLPAARRGDAAYLDELVGDLPSRAVKDER